MKEQLYPASRIAEFCGVTRQYVNRFCKSNCPEARSGKKIDISHPVMIGLLESKGVDLSKELRSATHRTHPSATTGVSQSESKLIRPAINKIDIVEHGNLTINEIAAYFGDHEQYRGWLAAKKQQVEIVEREIKVQERLGQLISRDMVSNSMIKLVDGFTSRLLTDFCKSAPVDLRAAVESGKDNIEMEKILRDLISRQLDQVVKKVAEITGD